MQLGGRFIEGAGWTGVQRLKSVKYCFYLLFECKIALRRVMSLSEQTG
jgi:hypothetical protein